VFAVIHLDAQNRVIDYVKMFRSTVSHSGANDLARESTKFGYPPGLAWQAKIAYRIVQTHLETWLELASGSGVSNRLG
jgi:hypothetical protein